MLDVRTEVSSSRALLCQLHSEVAAVLDLPSDGEPAAHSQRKAALHALVNKWGRRVSGKPQDASSSTIADDDCGDALAKTLQRQAMVTELKADLATFRTRRVQADAKANIGRKTAENVQLLQENARLRREMKALHDRLTLAEVANRSGAIASHPGAATRCRPRDREDAQSMQSIPEEALDRRDSGDVVAGHGMSSLDCDWLSHSPLRRAMTTRPASAVSTSPSTLPTPAKHVARPWSASAELEARGYVDRSQRRRPHSAWAAPSTERVVARRPHSCSVARDRPARILNELVGRERDQVSMLTAQLEASHGVVAEQQGEVRALQMLVRGLLGKTLDSDQNQHHEHGHGVSFGDAEDEETIYDGAYEGKDSNGGGPAGQTLQRQRSMSAQPLRPVPEHHPRGVVRPSSAGGVDMVTARTKRRGHL
jgi:hypothetical protein